LIGGWGGRRVTSPKKVDCWKEKITQARGGSHAKEFGATEEKRLALSREGVKRTRSGEFEVDRL